MALLLLVGIIGPPAPVLAATVQLRPPIELTSEQDHQRTMDLLQIAELRRGPDGDPISAHAANFDESKVMPYALPDPLLMRDGVRVGTRRDWWARRRPEIVEDFDREVYGLTATINETHGAVPVVTKDLVRHLDNVSYPLVNVAIQLTLTTPANAAGAV
ncbi:MAG TPA: hypothetical protein VII41_05535, partial [Steroidobacteraceae bacterium]